MIEKVKVTKVEVKDGIKQVVLAWHGDGVQVDISLMQSDVFVYLDSFEEGQEYLMTLQKRDN
jgi:hypothetical protein